MTLSEQRLELIKMVLEDGTIDAEEEESLHMLLQEHISKDAVFEQESGLTMGQRAADGLAKFAGSWTFIFVYLLIIFFWILINVIFLLNPYDPYPFVFLNLIMSCLSSVQAPIILMSQNRQDQKDRLRARNDYKVNLKSEIFIEDIHRKIDRILEQQSELAARLSASERSERES